MPAFEMRILSQVRPLGGFAPIEQYIGVGGEESPDTPRNVGAFPPDRLAGWEFVGVVLWDSSEPRQSSPTRAQRILEINIDTKELLHTSQVGNSTYILKTWSIP